MLNRVNRRVNAINPAALPKTFAYAREHPYEKSHSRNGQMSASSYR